MFNIFRKGKSNAKDFLMKNGQDEDRFSVIDTELRILNILQIIDNTQAELAIVVSSDDPIERKVMRDPRIIRAIKQANAEGVKILLILPPDIYGRISYLIPEPEIETRILKLYGLSFVAGDGDKMMKLSYSDEARAFFCFYPDFVTAMEIYGFLHANKLLCMTR